MGKESPPESATESTQPTEQPVKRGPGRPRKNPPPMHDETQDPPEKKKKEKKPYPSGKVTAGPLTRHMLARYRKARAQLEAMGMKDTPLYELYAEEVIRDFYEPSLARLEEYFRWEGIIPDMLTVVPPTAASYYVGAQAEKAARLQPYPSRGVVVCQECKALLSQGQAHDPSCLLGTGPEIK